MKKSKLKKKLKKAKQKLAIAETRNNIAASNNERWGDLFSKFYLELSRNGVDIVIDDIVSQNVNVTSLDDMESERVPPPMPTSDVSRLSFDFDKHDTKIKNETIDACRELAKHGTF